MALINYIVLINFAIVVISVTYALYGSLNLLFKNPENKKKQFSRTPVVFLYFCFIASASILMLIYSSYVAIGWRPDESSYNPILQYYISGIATIYINLVPVADFYLCLDRCAAFAFPLIFQQKLKFFLVVAFFITDFLILLFYFLITKWFSFTTLDTSTTCVYYICLIWRLNYPLVMTYTKYVFCGLNFVVSIILLGLIFFRNSSTVSNKLNKPVIYVSAINIFFAFAPALFLEFFIKIVGLGIAYTEYLGDTNLTCISISVALSVHLYFKTFKKHFMKKTNAIQVTPSIRTI